MSYKLILDGFAVDAVKDPCYVRYDGRLGLFLACKEEQAQGVASHDGNTYWHLEGRPEFGVDGYSTVSAVSISVEEADAIIAALDAGQPAPEPEPEPDPDPDGSIELVRENTITQMSAACNATITGGVDVTLSDGKTYHFSLGLEDQLNLLSLKDMISDGVETLPYDDGKDCRFYSVEDFNAIAKAATNWKLYQLSYFKSLQRYIKDMGSMSELLSVTYGMEIPEAYQSDVLKQLVAQMGGG